MYASKHGSRMGVLKAGILIIALSGLTLTFLEATHAQNDQAIPTSLAMPKNSVSKVDTVSLDELNKLAVESRAKAVSLNGEQSRALKTVCDELSALAEKNKTPRAADLTEYDINISQMLSIKGQNFVCVKLKPHLHGEEMKNGSVKVRYYGVWRTYFINTKDYTVYLREWTGI